MSEKIKLITGPPGCGKTTCLVKEASTRAKSVRSSSPYRWWSAILICTFTRAAGAEIAGRGLPVDETCIGTLHSHAYRALGCPPVAESTLAQFNRRHPTYRLTDGLVAVDEPGWDRRYRSPGDQPSEQYHVLRAGMVPRDRWPAFVRAFAETWERWKADTGSIDYSDMIEIAVRECPRAPGNPVHLLVDEAQDLTPLEYELVKRWGRAAGNLVAVGDPDQNLYYWRGSVADLFLDPDVPAEDRQILGQSYRVPRAVHELAMEWRRNLSDCQPLRYEPRDADGNLVRCSATYRSPEEAVDLAERQVGAGKSVMFAASCGYFLQGVLSEIRRRGIPFANPWRCVRRDWNPLLPTKKLAMPQRIEQFLRADFGGGEPRLWTREELANWTSVLRKEGLLKPGAEAKFRGLAVQPGMVVSREELVQLFEPEVLVELTALLDARARGGPMDTADMLDWFALRLRDPQKAAARYPMAVAKKGGVAALTESPRLYVGTIHSFKGAEADVVFVLPDLSPASFLEWSQPGTGRDAVVRLFYVALTRAREMLVLCQPGSARAVELGRYQNALSRKEDSNVLNL